MCTAHADLRRAWPDRSLLMGEPTISETVRQARIYLLLEQWQNGEITEAQYHTLLDAL